MNHCYFFVTDEYMAEINVDLQSTVQKNFFFRLASDMFNLMRILSLFIFRLKISLVV